MRFFVVLAERGRLKTSARIAGVGKETARRWVRERFVALRDEGLSVPEAKERLGFSSSCMPGWDEARARRGDGRHHTRREADVERRFWVAFDAGESVGAACRAAGVGRSTGYRWWRRRFVELREAGTSVRAATSRLRLGPQRAAAWEALRKRKRKRKREVEDVRRREQTERVAAVHASAAHARALLARRSRTATAERDAAYWDLMRQGVSNTAACRILGVSRKTG